MSLAVAAAAERAENEEKEEKQSQENLEILERERLASARAAKKAEISSGMKNSIPYATFVPRGVHTNIAFIQYLKGDYEAAYSHG